jgi:hypothetical protein
MALEHSAITTADRFSPAGPGLEHKCGLVAYGKLLILNANYYVAVDRVRSEPLTADSLVTGNNTEKISALLQKSSQRILYHAGSTGVLAGTSDSGPPEQGTSCGVSGNDRSLMLPYEAAGNDPYNCCTIYASDYPCNNSMR